ncbi:MAG: cohesin domain-containing protein [Candidatus Bathyarchaeia archaeon]
MLRLACLLCIMFFGVDSLTELFASPAATIYVHPAESDVPVGQTFNIEVKISEGLDIYGWEFKLKWNPYLLDVVKVDEGDFLKKGGDTFFASKTNNTAGSILVYCTLLGNVSGVNGNGTLATVQFKAEGQGESKLSIYETTLINALEKPVAHIAKDGKVIIGPKPLNIPDILIIVSVVVFVGIIFAGMWLFKFRKKRKAMPTFPVSSLISELEDDEKKIVNLLKSAGGRLLQSSIAEQLKFSRAKTSKLLKIMEDKGKIRREQKGREKIVTLQEKGEKSE